MNSKQVSFDINVEHIVEQSREELIEAVKQNVLKSVEWTVKQEVENQIKEVVALFFNDEITPHLTEALAGIKGEIYQGAIETVRQLSPMIAQALVKRAEDNLTKSWQVKEISEALFK